MQSRSTLRDEHRVRAGHELSFLLLVSTLLAGAWASVSAAQPAAIVKDIRQSSDAGPGAFAAGIGTVGDSFFFVGCDDRHGCELWTSDGTPVGSRMVADLRPGVGSGFPDVAPTGSSVVTIPSAVVGTRIFFVADDGTRGSERWSSDGTEAGTQVVKDISPGQASSEPAGLTAWGGALYFAAEDAVHGRELWKSDGSEGGTLLVEDVYPGATGSDPSGFAAHGEWLLFSADDGSHGRELWRTNGTTAGTTLLADIQPGAPGSAPISLLAAGPNVFFSADDGVVGRELWASDGTGVGTRLVKDLGTPSYWSSSPALAGAVGNVAIFVANDNAHGSELWGSDGTEVGTVLLGDLNAGPGNCDCAGFASAGGLLFFRASGIGTGSELWRTDGTAPGTQRVADISPGAGSSSPSSLTYAAGTLYFVASGGSNASAFQLWKSDGTGPGTVLVRDFGLTRSYDAQSRPIDVLWGVAGGALAFGADDGAGGPELWRSEGTGPTTSPLTNRVSVSSNPASTVLFGGQWYFGADDGVHGFELWKSDGTEAGTFQVKDIRPGSASSTPQALFATAGFLLFSADDGVHGRELWKSDGTEAGTVLVKDLLPSYGSSGPYISAPHSFVALDGAVHFLAKGDYVYHGQDLQVWRTDGTEAGTVLVHSLLSGEFATGLVVAGSTAYVGAYFAGNASINKDRITLWAIRSPSGPNGEVATAPDTLRTAACGGDLYFVARDGSPWVPGQLGLWRTDGTGAATLVSTLPTPEREPDLQESPIVCSGARLYFVVSDPVSGHELWTSDGTEAGTRLLADVLPGPGSSSPSDLLVLEEALLFAAADDSHGRELWRTDGTTVGTTLLADIRPGPDGSFPSGLTWVNGQAFLSANDGTRGNELWRTDGASVTFVQDLVAGSDSSLVAGLVPGPAGLLFSADDAVRGAEPWLLPSSELPLFGTVTGGGPICAGSSATVTVTVNGGTPPYTVTLDNGAGSQSGAGPSFSFTVSPDSTVTYAVTALTDSLLQTGLFGGSATVTVNHVVPAAPTAGSNSPVAAGGTLVLTATEVPGAAYTWSGPNGFTSTQQNPTIPDAGPQHAGAYNVTATVGGCTSVPGTTTVVVTLAPPVPAITSFTATPSVRSSAGTSTLAWTTTGATSVSISGLGGTFALSGTRDASVAATTTYTLTATNAAGSVTATATVNVLPGAGTSLGTPVITAPSAGQVVTVAGVGFTWNAVSSAAGYDVKLYSATSGATVFAGSLVGNGSTSTLVTLPDGSYLFAVRACNASGFANANCGAFATRSFSVAKTSPTGAPTVTAPTQGAVLTASTQTFSWTAVPKADPGLSLSYEVLLTDVAGGNIPDLQITVPDPTLSTIYTLHSSALYELKVRACQAGCGPWSAPVTFSVDLPDVPTTAPSIPTCSVSGGNSLTCSWSAVSGADVYSFYVVQPTGGPGGGALTVAARLVSTTTVTLPVPQGFANVIVAACTGDGCGPWSGARGINPAGPNPSSPNLGTPLAASVVNGPGVEFSWNRVPGDDGTNTWYRLYVQDLSRQAAALDVYTRDNFYAAYFKAEGARYDALVVANPGASQVVGPPIGFNVRGLSASAPTMVSPPHQSQVQAGNLQLGWTPVPGATLYQYWVAVLGQGTPAVTGVTPGLVVQVPLPAVGGAATTYSGITRACMSPTGCSPTSDTGWGPWSNAPGGPGVTNFTVIP